MLNTLATYPATIAASFALLTALLYGIGSPWYRSLLGWVLFGLFAGSVPVFALVVVRRIATTLAVGGPSTNGDGFGALSFAVYTFAALAWIATFVALVVERRNKPMVQKSFDKRRPGH
jgi:hypothetical protein